MRRRLIRISRGFAIAIVIVLAFGWLFSQYTDTLSEDRQEAVLIQAIPFVAVFVTIILAFAWLIVVVAVGLEGKVPQCTYRPMYVFSGVGDDHLNGIETGMDEPFIPPPESLITLADWQHTPDSVQRWVIDLWAQNNHLRETVEVLEELVSRNSQSASQPPSQERPNQKPAREPSGLPHKRGGQPGHRGHHRALVDEVDEMLIHKPISCAGCGALLLGDDPSPYRHQVTELPIVKLRVIEHQVHSLDCPCCGHSNRGEPPPEVAASWFGPNGISLVGLLMGRFQLSKRQVTYLLAECFAIHMAASTVVNQQQVISQALAQPVADLQPYVHDQLVCNVDETSWQQMGAAKRPWLWTVVTAQVTLFRIVPSRSGQVARELLGDHYNGVAGTDRCSAYTWLERRQLCWSHLLDGDAALWQFVSVPGLEPTNNSAERARRHPGIWRRTSHGTQSDSGSRFVERTLTVVATCRQQ